MSTSSLKIGFMGGGQMASALIGGIVSSKTVSGPNVFVYDPSPQQLDQLHKKYSITPAQTNMDVVRKADVIFVAVKPHLAENVLKEVNSSLDPSRHIVISICAGLSLDTLASWIPAKVKLVRVMPNTPALVGKGASGFSIGPTVTKSDTDIVQTLLDSVGVAILVPEKDLGGVTGVSGSGPAYIFIVIEALADGGVKAGLTRPAAQALAAQTVLGAAEMVLKTGQHPGALKDAVCSAGGATIAAVHALEMRKVRAAFIEAVMASKNRAEEMGAPQLKSKM